MGVDAPKPYAQTMLQNMTNTNNQQNNLLYQSLYKLLGKIFLIKLVPLYEPKPLSKAIFSN